MARFLDKDDNPWKIELDAYAIRDVRKECGIDLADGDGAGLNKMADDPVLLVDVLWVLCREQAEKQGIKAEQFGKALIGDAIDRAVAAMLESIADFFPRQKRDLIQTVQAKNAKMRELGMAKALEKINDPALESRVLADMEAELDAQIERSLTRLTSAKNSPDSSASIPAA